MDCWDGYWLLALDDVHWSFALWTEYVVLELQCDLMTAVGCLSVERGVDCVWSPWSAGDWSLSHEIRHCDGVVVGFGLAVEYCIVSSFVLFSVLRKRIIYSVSSGRADMNIEVQLLGVGSIALCRAYSIQLNE